MIEFEEWPKIPRLFRDCVITEKIDGINAAVVIDSEGQVGAQTRTSLITADTDPRGDRSVVSGHRYGFARWVSDNSEELRDLLGVGHHFGEWWGQGIRRKYGLSTRRFSLFNTTRYNYLYELNTSPVWAVPTFRTVPILYSGPFSTEVVNEMIEELRIDGSSAAPGFMKPEGVIVYMPSSNQMYKATLEGDEAPKNVGKIGGEWQQR